MPCLFYGGIVWAALAAGRFPYRGILTPLNPVAHAVRSIAAVVHQDMENHHNTQTATTDAPGIKRRRCLNVRPLINEEYLPFVGKVKRKAKNGKYQTKTHYWRVKKDASAIDGLQYGVDLMDVIKANQSETQTANLIVHILQDTYIGPC